MLWIFATAVGVIGCILLGLGVRGRRKGKAPHCRSCNFELTGLVGLSPAEAQPQDDRTASRCPECGSTFVDKRAVAIGKHERRRLVAGLGVLALILAVGFGALALSASNTSLNSKKPTWLLMIEATKLHGTARDAAADELFTRHQKKPLSNDQLAALIEPALDAQLYAKNVQWLQSPWLELLDASFVAKVVTPRQLKRYATNAFAQLDTTLPDVMLADESWPADMQDIYQLMPISRAPVVPIQPLYFAAPLIAAELDGKSLELKALQRPSSSSSEMKWFGWTHGYSIRGTPGFYTSFGSTSSKTISGSESYEIIPWNTTLGEHTLRLTYAVAVYAGLSQSRGMNVVLDKPLASWKQTVEHTLHAYEKADEISSFVGPDDYPDFDAACKIWSMPNSIVVDRYLNDQSGNPTYRASISVEMVSTVSSNDPILMGHIELRHGDQHWIAGSVWKDDKGPLPLTVSLGSGTRVFRGMGLSAILPHDFPHYDTMDVVIVPDLREAALHGLDRKVWNQEVIIKDVPFDWTAVTADKTDK